MTRIPTSTYRFQFSSGFRFCDARPLVAYLARLGITDCYSSPQLKACPGSEHGYDICDHSQLNPELGTEEEYAAFTAELAAHGMGQVVDIVPNHMAIDPAANLWWRDVLENGRCSAYANYFDIDWEPIKQELKDKILLPILGDQYGRVLDRGELKLCFENGAFTLRYFEQALPINPRQFPKVLEHDLEALRAELGEADAQLSEYLSIITSLHNLPTYTETGPERVAERHREKEVAKQRLQRLAESSQPIRAHIERAVRELNGVPGEARTFDVLHELLEAQPYRLSYWRTASHEINYRRFFDINQLAGVRVEDREVFCATHDLVIRLMREGKITGLRIDHIDGLFAPELYLRRLQDAIPEPSAAGSSGDSPPGGDGAGESVTETVETVARQPGYVVVEKILTAGERLPQSWSAAGTSGYDFLNDLNRLFVDQLNYRVLQRIYRRFTRRSQAFDDLLYECKQLIMDSSMASELNVLAGALNRLSERDRHTRDFTLNSLRQTLREVIACFPVYRSYVTNKGFSEEDRATVETAIRRARQRNPAIEASVFDFLRDVLLPRPERTSESEYRARVEFAMKLQQYTGPVQAKGLEDTAFYRHNLLVSLNEVGADPERFGSSTSEFHEANRRRAERWPLAMLATATHDTKRGEDVRARLNVLSEMPEQWGRHVSTWAGVNARNRTLVGGEPAPDRNDEYLFYQTLLGAWPAGSPSNPDGALVERIRATMLKAVKEAKVHTSWITANESYEQAVAQFVDRTLTGPTAARFLPLFLPFQRRIAGLGMINSLAQVVLKVASPGVPDFYQGAELWDLNLVDPDNRRPVDYAKRQQMLSEIERPLSDDTPEEERALAVRTMVTDWQDGRIKLFVTAAALRLRRTLREVFLAGSYEPVNADADRDRHVVAFGRWLGKEGVIAVTPRLTGELMQSEAWIPVGANAWGAAHLHLPRDRGVSRWRNVFTGESVDASALEGGPALELARVFANCPVALLATWS